METNQQNDIKNAKQPHLSEYTGKYVCFGNSDGGFCFGKIDSVVEINTVYGSELALVLLERIVGNNGTLRRFKDKTLLRLSTINPEEHIFDIDMEKLGLGAVSDDALFLLMMNADVSLLGNETLPTGIKNLFFMASEQEVAEAAIKELKKRKGDKDE